MKYFAAASAALLATTTFAQAGGIERDQTSMDILFKEGNYVELGFTFVSPDVSGSLIGVPTVQSGDMLGSYSYSSLAFRSDITENLSYAVIWNQPFGVDVSYPITGALPFPGGTGYPLQGLTATVDAQALNVLLRYEFENNFSVYGGLRAVEATGAVSIPTFGQGAGYSMDVDGSTELGYILGAAYERPDIALRVSLTYQSATDHTFTGTEQIGGTTLPSTFETTIPQSLTLQAQSGIAPGTLLFGSIRWVDWSEFSVAPPVFGAPPPNGTGDALANNSRDVFTYRLGIGRQFSERWSGLAAITYEPTGVGSAFGNDLAGNLDPRDGRLGIGLGARWNNGAGLEISGGVEYMWFGDTDTAAIGTGAPFGRFTDNTGYAASIRVGYSF